MCVYVRKRERERKRRDLVSANTMSYEMRAGRGEERRKNNTKIE